MIKVHSENFSEILITPFIDWEQSRRINHISMSPVKWLKAYRVQRKWRIRRRSWSSCCSVYRWEETVVQPPAPANCCCKYKFRRIVQTLWWWWWCWAAGTCTTSNIKLKLGKSKGNTELLNTALKLEVIFFRNVLCKSFQVSVIRIQIQETLKFMFFRERDSFRITIFLQLSWNNS